ncbi:MAG: sulfatase-like hydrolase/transferase [Bacteroidota bacterium]|nr:sulfatase-like hydrolase/transferase [Bacteroidota bacterium]
MNTHLQTQTLASWTLLIVLTLLSGCSQEEPAQPLNFLVVITDDQRNDMLGLVHPVLETPVMDQLADNGYRFPNAFVTTPICAASRASMLTGLVETTHQYTFGTYPLSTRARFV